MAASRSPVLSNFPAIMHLTSSSSGVSARRTISRSTGSKGRYLPARLSQLTLDDIITGDDGQVSIRLGSQPSPVPEPFAEMLTEPAANRRT